MEGTVPQAGERPCRTQGAAASTGFELGPRLPWATLPCVHTALRMNPGGNRRQGAKISHGEVFFNLLNGPLLQPEDQPSRIPGEGVSLQS